MWTDCFGKPCTTRATKSDILQYLAGVDAVQLQRVNGDWQITDEAGYPLIDAWHETNFCNKFWRLETCGKTILNMSESLPWCMPLSYHSTRSRVNVYDWNGDFYGAILTTGGALQPVLILSSERRVVAKILVHRPVNTTKQTPVSINPSNSDVAIIDMERLRDDSREPLALALDSGGNDAPVYSAQNVLTPSSGCEIPLDPSNNDLNATREITKLICISSEENGKHLARLYGNNTIWFCRRSV